MTKRGVIILLSGAIVLLLAVSWEIHTSVSRPRAKVGHIAPSFTAETVRGQQFSLSAIQNEPVLLDFFATWCGPCQQEMPALNRFAAAAGSQVKIVMIDRGDSKVMIQRFIQKYHVSKNITVLYNQPDKLSGMYQVSGQPEAVFINRSGTVLYHTKGPLTEAKMLQWAHQTGVGS